MYRPATVIESGRRGPLIKPGKQAAMFMGGLAGAVLVLTGGLYFWQTGEITKIEQEVAAKRDQVNDGERTAKQLKAVQADAAVTENKLHNLEQNVSRGQYVPSLMIQLEGLAKNDGLQIDALRPTWKPAAPPPAAPSDKEGGKKTREAPPPPYDELKLEMSARGNYKNVARFIHSLTHFQKIIAVDAVQQQVQSITSVTGSSPQLAVRINMTGYVFKGDGPSNLTNQANGAAPGSAKQVRSEQRAVLDAVR